MSSTEKKLSLSQSHRETEHRLRSDFQGTCELESSSRPPQLLSDLGETGLVWLLFKEKAAVSSNKVFAARIPKRTVPKDRGETEHDLDLTGSPLKCSFTLDESFSDEEENLCYRASSKSSNGLPYVPLSSREARNALSKFNVLTSSLDATCVLPCWAVVDGGDGGILFMGSKRTSSSLSLTTVECTGPYASKDKALKFDIVKKKHDAAGCRGGSGMSSHACVVYNLCMGDPYQSFAAEEESEPVNDLSSQLQLCMQWTKPHSLLEAPTLDALACIKGSIEPGDEKMPSYDLWLELSSLQSFSAGLDNKGVVWRARRNDDDEGEDMEESLEAFIENVQQLGPRGNSAIKGRTSPAFDESDSEVDRILAGSRQDVDFTDLLWSFLHKVESYEELCHYLKVVLSIIKEEEIRPYLYSNSCPIIGKLVQSIVRGSASIPSMKDKFPLEILVEIGIEKLRRDYVHAFVSTYLATKEDMKPFLETSDRVQSLSSLKQLHKVLELAILLQTYLSLGQDCLRGIVQQSLNRGFDSKDFSFEMQSAAVKDQLAKLQPNTWQCVLCSTGDRSSAETVVHLSVDAPSQLIPYDDIRPTSTDDGDARQEAKYFCTVKSSIIRHL